MGTLRYSLVRPALAQSDLTAIAPYLFWLMFRNVASDGFVFDDPALQTLAILRLYAQLDAPTQATANAVIAANLNFLQDARQWPSAFGPGDAEATSE
jgi:hypothetical protein